MLLLTAPSGSLAFRRLATKPQFTQILGLVTYRTVGDQLKHLMLRLVDEIKKFWFTSGAHIFYILERNVGCENEHYALLQGRDRVQMLSDHCGTYPGDEPRPGIVTDAKKKTEYQLLLSYELRNESIIFIDEMIVVPSPGGDPATTRVAMRAQLIEQMKRARLTMPGSQLAHANTAVSWSAKVGSDGKPGTNFRDDLLLSFVFILYVIKRLRDDTWPGVDMKAFRNRF